ncbi:hypothetical protein QE417_002885 [Mucilaginibacter terrae]|uniref:Uncharacterized protein n=2 Tax=Mucilaginibacter terrae TaxID=1955052 RepID=A0ABU3GVK9_9SPHI|nr:hypothetical protein [Mucilaginibacter terrae]
MFITDNGLTPTTEFLLNLLWISFFYIFVIMAQVSISNKDWPRVKIKLKRKYNHLSEEDLQYTEGQEDKLITTLAERVNRNADYVVFTLKKALVNIDNNRL